MENFTLKSFKLKGFDAEVRYTQIVDDYECEYKATLAKGIQESLRLQLDVLKEAAKDLLGFTEEQAKLLEVKGVILSGKEDNAKAAIYCSFETPAGFISFRSPKIAYKASDSQTAILITNALPLLENAVYDFLFNGAGEELEEV